MSPAESTVTASQHDYHHRDTERGSARSGATECGGTATLVDSRIHCRGLRAVSMIVNSWRSVDALRSRHVRASAIQSSQRPLLVVEFSRAPIKDAIGKAVRGDHADSKELMRAVGGSGSPAGACAA